MEWHIKSFNELTPRELYDILAARSAVFVVEQDCLYQDPDGHKDFVSEHLFALDDGEIAAYCRLLPRGVRFSEAAIGRVITPRKYRGTGLGRELMVRGIEHITKVWNEPYIRISGQSYLRLFYESLGFHVVSEEYLEDNIPHFEFLLGHA